MDWGTVPQWITGAVALGAAGIALHSIETQREIARKRAAMDFFAKTEMDKHTLDAHGDYLKGVAALKGHLAQQKCYDAFLGEDACKDIREYLNLHELMAVGISQNVFDDNVCFDFWKGELTRAYSDTAELIKKIQEQPKQKYTYIELVKLAKRWNEGRPERTERSWRSRLAATLCRS
jgi:hypothetical protein